VKNLISFFFLFLVSVVPFPAHAEITLSPNDSATMSLSPHLGVLEDSSRLLTFEDVLKKNSFLPQGNEPPVPGYTSSAWWVRFSLHNPTTNTIERYMEFADSGEGIPSITTFVQNAATGAMWRYEMGGNIPQSQKTWDHRHGVLPLSVPPQSTLHIFIRSEGDSIKIPLLLHTSGSFYSSTYAPMIWIGIVYGFLLVIFVWNMTIFFAAKDKSYLYYAFFVAGQALTLSSFDGLSGQYLFPNSRYLFTHSVNVASSYAIGFLLLFMHEFLNLKNQKSTLWRLGRHAAFFAIAVGTLNLFWKTNALVNLTVSVAALLCIALSVRAAYLNIPFSHIFLFPIAAFLGTVLVTTLKQAGVLASSFFTEESLRFGAMISTLFWTLALAYRFRKIMYAQHDLQKNALEVEISTQKSRVDALQSLNNVVVDMSDKLNSPLLVVLRVFERLRERALHIEDAVNNSNTVPDEKNVAVFFNAWKHHSQNISIAIKQLTTLSQELSERREESIQREALEKSTP
jgi:hypothetical protein